MAGGKRMEATVEWQRMPPKGDDDYLLVYREDGGLGLLGACLKIGDALVLLPIGDGLRVNLVAICQRFLAHLTLLYRLADRLRRRGAPMSNRSHSASFDSCGNDALLKPRIKQLV